MANIDYNITITIAHAYTDNEATKTLKERTIPT